jgi:hypothetical protein
MREFVPCPKSDYWQHQQRLSNSERSATKPAIQLIFLQPCSLRFPLKEYDARWDFCQQSLASYRLEKSRK